MTGKLGLRVISLQSQQLICIQTIRCTGQQECVVCADAGCYRPWTSSSSAACVKAAAMHESFLCCCTFAVQTSSATSGTLYLGMLWFRRQVDVMPTVLSMLTPLYAHRYPQAVPATHRPAYRTPHRAPPHCAFLIDTPQRYAYCTLCTTQFKRATKISAHIPPTCCPIAASVAVSLISCGPQLVDHNLW